MELSAKDRDDIEFVTQTAALFDVSIEKLVAGYNIMAEIYDQPALSPAAVAFLTEPGGVAH